MIKAIVFDFGGVLVRTEDDSSRRQWEMRLGLGERDLDRLVFDSDIAIRATLGEVPDSAIWANVAKSLKLTADQVETLRRDFWAGEKLDPDLVALLASLRPNYQTAILSNAWFSGRETIARLYGLEQAVDIIFISAEEGLAKPDPRLYQLVAQRLGVRPSEVVLVDDFSANVEGARAAGWEAIHYRSGLDVRAELKRLDVESPPAPESAGGARQP
jgi:epoxide hydrolase-like predicted phosphatase